MSGVVRVASAGGLRQEIHAGSHHLVGDEPLGMRGTDAGPDPYDFLLVALGTCTSMTLQVYARRKGWPLEGVRVSLRHPKIHAADSADCETRSGTIDQIERVIELAGPLDDEQRRRLLEIAEKCPVHRTLTSEIGIRSRVVP
ncbi:MAG TPA: OsmC family protein [Haliangiales bacterium]|nr:OsmC family protein [Haliangiales bacterium]